jgi:hypothetical protein
MEIPSDLKVTTEILLRGALIFALIDFVYVAILFKLVKPAYLKRMKWNLVIIMALFFFILLGSVMSILFWDSVYSYVFPSKIRWIIPPVYGLLFSAAGLLFWRISIRSTKYSVVIFCLFGGLWGMLTHILAIERGILDKPPTLKGSSPFAALTIAAFEFIFYWCLCLTISGSITALRAKRQRTHGI